MSTEFDPLGLPTGEQVFTAITSRVRAAFAHTPGMLRAGLIGCLAVVILFAFLATDSLSSRRAAIADARDAAAQVVLVQRVRTNLVEADALATNAFLVGGLEPPEQREAYAAGIASASDALINAAANADDDDIDELATASESLTRYTGLIESARANNRQGFPVGVAYLKQASALLRNDVLPALDTVSTLSQARVDDAYGASDTANNGLLIGAFLVVVVLVVVQVQLSKRTRRTFNVGILAGSVAVGLVLILALTTMTAAADDANDARDRYYHDATAITQARINAFEAKSAESLTLIARGNGATFEEQWVASFGRALDALSGMVSLSLSQDLQAYADVHAQVRELDDAGRWDDAVELATGFREGSSNAVFDQFDFDSAELLRNTASDLDDALESAGSTLNSTRIAVLLFALVAAGLIAWGFNQRLREYR